ncbi:TPA: hypothetical protein ACWSRJ_000911 [Klebsiella pneumoniae]
MTTDITELAQLRADLSNPAISSKDHLRKLALLLIDELEESRSQITKHEDFIREQDQLIAVLKRNLHASMQRTVTVKLQSLGFIIVSGERVGVYMKADVDAALAAAGIKVEVE